MGAFNFPFKHSDFSKFSGMTLYSFYHHKEKKVFSNKTLRLSWHVIDGI